MKLTFYNHYGNGDLFESREFVRDWMRLAGVTEADYAHRALPGFFADLPGITSVPVTPEMDMRRSVTWGSPESRVESRGPDIRPSTLDPRLPLWVNTWVGRDGQYVVNPGIGCVVEQIYRMHNDLLREAGFPALPRSVAEYLPTIDYTRLHVNGSSYEQMFSGSRPGHYPSWIWKGIHRWLDAHAGQRLVMVCNGPTGSSQAENFDMGEMVALLPPMKDTLFLLTQKGNAGGPPAEPGDPPGSRLGEIEASSESPLSDRPVACPTPIIYTDDLTCRETVCEGWDLNLISYISRYCDVIIGRCSGAQMHTQVLENWMDSRKTQVCFTHHRNGACFVLDPGALGLRMKVKWSPASTPADAARFLMEEVL